MYYDDRYANFNEACVAAVESENEEFRPSPNDIEARLSPVVAKLLKMGEVKAIEWITANTPIFGYACTAVSMYKRALFLLMLNDNRAMDVYQNEEIPLQLRWAVFCSQVADFSKVRSMCSELDEYFGEGVVMCDGEYHTERYQTHDVVEIVEELRNMRIQGEPLRNFDPDKAKMMLMRDNLRLFTYDW